MTRFLWLLLSIFLLSGCVARPRSEPFPPYVVSVSNRCTGVAISSSVVLTMDHCVTYGTVFIEKDGRRYPVGDREKFPQYDLAILWLDDNIGLSSYAKLSSPDLDKPALVYGNCMLSMPFLARKSFFYYRDSFKQRWYSVGLFCGGDSGGPFVQNEKVIGLVSARSKDLPIEAGHIAVIIPSEVIEDVLSLYVQ